MSEENISQVDEKYCLDDTLLPSAETNHVNLSQYQTGHRISVKKCFKECLLKKLKNNEKMKIDEQVRSEKKKSITSGKKQSSKKRIFRCSGKKSLKLIPSLCSSSDVDMVKESQVTRSDSDLKPMTQTGSSSKTGLSEKKEIGSKVTSPSVKVKVVEPIRSDPRPIRQTSSSSKTCLSEKKEIGSKVFSPPMKMKVVEPIGSDPRPIRQTSSSSKTVLSENKEIGSAKTESKMRPKRIGSKITSPPMIVEPKQEDSNQTLLKLKNRTVQEPKLNKKNINLKDKREGVGKINDEGEGEKVVLRHRELKEKEKSQNLFNNLIEETVNKFEEGKKSKVKALVGAFETVISLQDVQTQTSEKKMIQIKPPLMGM